MKLASKERSLTAWVLYISILFSSFACAIHHGQMAGLQLSGLNGQFCSLTGSTTDIDIAGDNIAAHATAGTDCVLGSLFSAIILAAFFGLLGLLLADRARPLPRLLLTFPRRYRWPPANPRASPATLSAC